LKIKKILVTQPKPENEKSPYFDLAKNVNVKVDFRAFVQVEGVSLKEFRRFHINIPDFSAVIFTSRTAIDHFFRIAQEMRVAISEDMKYFCISETIALYLQKYTIYRKRKIFIADGKFEDLLPIILKHKNENYLIPVSDVSKQEFGSLLEKSKIKHTEVVFYKTVSCDLSDLKDMDYDVVVFYTPTGVKALMQNFPEFKQNELKIASFGLETAKAVKSAGLRLDIKAPTPTMPSMTMALENYIKKMNKPSKTDDSVTT